MRLKVVFILIFCGFSIATAQTYEVGVWAGGSSVIGDVGSTQYIDPTDLAFGGIFKWNRSNRHAFRFTLIRANMIGDDNDSSDPSRDLRGYKYDYDMIEASLGVEYNFWEWDVHNGRTQLVPYLYTGITGFQYEEFGLNTTSNQLEAIETSRGMAIPIVLGLKINLAENFVLGVEAGARYTFTDNLDGSKPDDGDGGVIPRNFGNLNNNDWYMFTGATLTYTFGRKPCYCNF